MSNIRRGFVEFIHSKERQSKRGDGTYTSYNAKLQDPETGKVDEQWYRFGFKEPKQGKRVMEVGDFVEVEWEKDGDARKVVDGSLRISAKKRAKPADPDAKGDSGSTGGAGGKPTPVKESKLFGQIGGYMTEDDVGRITRSTALEAATRTVEMLLSNKALKISEAQGAQGVVKRYDNILTAIDKLAVKYFLDLATGRQLEAHEDEGTVPSAKTSTQDLPDSEPATDDDFDDELPPMPPEEDDDDF